MTYATCYAEALVRAGYLVIHPNLRHHIPSDAVVLYGSMNADLYLNYEWINTFWSGETEGLTELATPPELLARISPVNYLDRVEAPVAIHHGGADSDVPVAWSTDLCQRLTALDKRVDCFIYEGQDHILTGESDALFEQRVAEFFEAAFK